MTLSHVSSAVLQAAALTSAGFAAFGEVIEHSGTQRRRHFEAPFLRDPRASVQRLWVSRVDEAIALKTTVATLERHVRSAQTFIPLTGSPYLVVVAPTLPDGLPDLDGLRAFVATGRQGVTYRPGVWHHGLAVLEAPAQFVVTMAMADDGQDDQFRPLPRAVDVEVPRFLLQGAQA